MKQDQYYFNNSAEVSSWREDHENRFLNYIHHMRRTCPRYYNVKCQLKIDFITFSIYLKKDQNSKSDESSLMPLVNEILKMKVENPKYSFNKKYFYDRSAAYKFRYKDHIHQLIIAKSSKEPFKPYLLTIHDPTPDVLKYLENHLIQFDHYHVKDIENSFDFCSEDLDLIKKYLEQHTIVSWRGKGYHPEYDTFYGNNIRFAKGKGLRVYNKEEVNEAGVKNQFIRMEMRLKRPILKVNGIENVSDVLEMDDSIVKKYFSFNTFRCDKLEIRMRNEGYSKEIIDEIMFGIIDEIKDGYLYEVNRKCLRLIKNYNTDSYIKKSIFWYHFVYQLRSSSFLNGDVFRLSSLLMEDETLE